ncbi:hypothetical protein C4664_23140 [Salmonella enterica subsp. enterica serovar Kiambu]|uniref:Uncharacterized protein n=1 Tax=Escherichia coli TaxID=562 RepID=A0A0N9DYP5_ECOLX|nr:hypothetical protein [Escherichia coli]ALF35499.1 hypothetical protein AZ95_0085 [Escherichia coli]PVS13631.1 hypothetical protein C4664_23140 [Salmonella enterica subsp. enterica serovar Kiambu]
MNPGASCRTAIASKKLVAILAGREILLASCSSGDHPRPIFGLLRKNELYDVLSAFYPFR